MKKNLLASLVMFSAVLLLGAGCSPFGSDKVATTGPAGVFVSTDKAETWKPLSIFPGPTGTKSLSGVGVYKLVKDPHDKDILYWASRGSGLFYTHDLGKTWQLSPEPLNTGFIYSIAINPKDKCILYATNGTRVYQTKDCTINWSEVYREAGNDRIISIVTDPFSPARLYMLKTKGDVLVSDDTGISWRLIKRLNVPAVSLELDPYKEGVIYVATQKKGLYRSEDGGANWVSIEKALKSFTGGLEFRRLVFSPSQEGTVYWISTYGILESKDRGTTWAPFNILNAPGTIRIYGFAINPKNDQEMYYIGTIEERPILYKTVNGGIDWITKRLPTDQIPTSILIDSDKDNTVYVGFAIPPKQ